MIHVPGRLAAARGGGGTALCSSCIGVFILVYTQERMHLAFSKASVSASSALTPALHLRAGADGPCASVGRRPFGRPLRAVPVSVRGAVRAASVSMCMSGLVGGPCGWSLYLLGGCPCGWSLYLLGGCPCGWS
eukprot:366064-Chlamydomonas_euryale.AAC.8